MRRVNKALLALVALTLFFVVIHIRQVVSFENPSGEINENIYSGDVLMSTNMSSNDESYIYRISFSGINSEVRVDSLDVRLGCTLKNGRVFFNLQKVLPYQGMLNWDIPEFRKFELIPDSLRVLKESDNPYFAYDFVFDKESDKACEEYLAAVSADIQDGAERISFTREIPIRCSSELKVRAFDTHSDVTILFIPLFGFLSLVLFLVSVLQYIYNRYKSTSNRIN